MSNDKPAHSFQGETVTVTSTPTGTDVPEGYEYPQHQIAAEYIIGAPARDIAKDELVGMDPSVIAEIEQSPLYGNGGRKAKAGTKTPQGGDDAPGTASGATGAQDGGSVGVNKP